MHSLNDTIAAIATASGRAAISVVRLSGPDSLPIADRIVRCGGPPPSARPGGSFLHGFVVDPDQRRDVEDAPVIDEVIVLIFRAPASYTREDVVEIQGHGGRECARRILQAALAAGATPAAPGEFTRRAFLHGRVDLTQAEAVMDVISSQSDRAASAAIDQLRGRLRTGLDRIYDVLLAAAADMEALLDFPEEDFPDRLFEDAKARVRVAGADLKQMLTGWHEGHLMREGALVVISGRPNVGKSTLLNALLGSNRAIVSHHPGTTRDTIEEAMVLEGIPLRLVDTAGIRETQCDIERQGIDRAHQVIERADLRLHMLDASKPTAPEDADLISRFPPACTILILNKTDLGFVPLPSSLSAYAFVSCSLLRDEGLAGLREAMVAKLELTSSGETPQAAVSQRHRRLIEQAVAEIEEALKESYIFGAESLVIFSGRLRAALDALGLVTGRVYSEELLDSIFSRFCIGK